MERRTSKVLAASNGYYQWWQRSADAPATGQARPLRATPAGMALADYAPNGYAVGRYALRS